MKIRLQQTSLFFIVALIALAALSPTHAYGTDLSTGALTSADYIDANSLHDPTFVRSGKSSEFQFEQWIAISHIGGQDGMFREYIITAATSTASIIDLMDPLQGDPKFIFIVKLEQPYVTKIAAFARDPKHTTALPNPESGSFQVAMFTKNKMTDYHYMSLAQSHALFSLLAKLAHGDKRHSDDVKKAFDLYLPFFAQHDLQK